MKIDRGSRLGPYEISSRIGAGGMGEVWRATDTRLERSVAVKILPSEFAENAQLRMRFEREAKTISQLNHPNICTLYDVGTDSGTHYLVMELLDGETLADRLQRGPLPLDHALRIGIEIASALDRAHREGVVHRDLKPSNIVLTKSGAKLLDFGLAKSGLSTPSGESVINAATQAKPLTQEGTIVGTFQYMSPEQVSGEAVDARTDIFAFGAVMYEMLTGKAAFGGKNRTSIIAAILSGEPQPISALQPLTPPALERVVKTCLAKDADDRWQTAHDVMLELKWIEEGGSQAGVAAPVVHRRRTRERVSWSIAIVALIAAAALWVLYVRALHAPSRVLKMAVPIPEELKLTLDQENVGSLTISPSGRYVTFPATSADGKKGLWLRAMDGSPQLINGTDNAVFPFWSPDSRFIAFFADGKLKKVDLDGSPPLTLCDAPQNPRSGSWNKDGTIIFSPTSITGIYRVSTSGGTAAPVTKLQTGETTHRWATFLPDGKHFIYMAGTHAGGTKAESNAVYIDSIEKPSRKLLLRARSNVEYANGYLLYAREKTLVAQPFDASKLELTGDPIPVTQDIQYAADFFRAIFSVSNDGTLVYASGSADVKSTMFEYDRSGKQGRQIGEPEYFRQVAVSSDGKRLAFTIEDHNSGISNIWLQDADGNVRTRFTFCTSDCGEPTWSHDGTKIAYTSVAPKGPPEIHVKDVDGNGGDRLISPDDGTLKRPIAFSPDGKLVLFSAVAFNGNTRADVFAIPVTGGKAFPVLNTSAGEDGAVMSPDGKWVVYVSDESGRNEIYVTDFPQHERKWQLSNNGGGAADWSRDGREIIYYKEDGKGFAVPVTTSATSVNFGAPQPIFDIPLPAVGNLSADHQHWFIAKPALWNPTLHVVTNWPATVRK
jgi:Tol biopolymer transport system component